MTRICGNVSLSVVTILYRKIFSFPQIKHGADLNQMTHYSSRWSGPPLYLAINNKNASMVEALLSLGASTVPQPLNYCQIRIDNGTPAPWKCFNSKSKISYRVPPPSLQHSNAVAMGLNELMKKGQDVDAECDGMKVLMVLLSAHGDPLGPSPEVLLRVLMNSRLDDFLMLLDKLYICSRNCQDSFAGRFSEIEGNARSTSQQHLQQMDQHLHNNNNIGEEGRGNSHTVNFGDVTSLQNQARRVVRQAVMCSGHNVLWATKRLDCPPALKSIILLKDIDRAHLSPPHTPFKKS